ncbi:MAG: c-type cytochrome [Methylocystis sp.]
MTSRITWAKRIGAVVAALLLEACRGAQSALAPQSLQAERVAALFWAMTVGAAFILIGVMFVTALALFGPESWRRWLGRDGIIVAGGIVFPVITLTALLAYGFVLMSVSDSQLVGGEPVKTAVVGERWWWRVIYRDSGGRRIESANELRIPVGRPVEIELTSADVIHSFWAPKLAGKLDMIPGRKNILTLLAKEGGVSRGQCAEYCGGAHALMAFYVVAMPQPEYERWLAHEAAHADAPLTPQAQAGMALFAANGCGACHAIRGTAAAGAIGPDLTHVGGRLSLAAATLPNDEAAFARWIKDNQHIKPGNLMPPYGIFSDSELAAVSNYLASLR